MSGYRTSTAYQETEVLSTSPERLVPLLYEHLLVNLKKGVFHIKKENIEGKYEALSRAQDIVAELLSSLDFDAGGELATRLASLYGFWAKEISGASRDLSAARIMRVAEMVGTLHESWEQAARAVETGEASLERGPMT